MYPNDKRSLETALHLLEQENTPKILNQVDQYIQLLQEWNQRVNLISKQDVPRLMGRHILESIGLIDVIAFPTGSHVVDIGTGAGLPGVPLAIVRPDLQVTLIESKRKKILFLQKVIQSLGLDNVELYHGRMEETVLSNQTDFALSRAVADISTLCQWSFPLFENRPGILIAMKGLDINEELEGLKNTFLALHPEQIPYHPFPGLPDTRAGQLIQIQLNLQTT
ncbi:16S rRNA (guanine(527)-N(7))-methyltransferase RsmG [candidate division KSB1 bacterium]|nr:16S rRNA (guanine(527)-N(7))-methyltransferase RsmG [candidate division KSB1 bacterium]